MPGQFIPPRLRQSLLHLGEAIDKAKSQIAKVEEGSAEMRHAKQQLENAESGMTAALREAMDRAAFFVMMGEPSTDHPTSAWMELRNMAQKADLSMDNAVEGKEASEEEGQQATTGLRMKEMAGEMYAPVGSSRGIPEKDKPVPDSNYEPIGEALADSGEGNVGLPIGETREFPSTS